MRLLRITLGYVHRQFLAWLAGRAFLLTLVINQAITPLLGLAVWSAALPGQPQLSSYYVALLTVQLMTVSYEHHTFANGIYAGDLNNDLLRPHPVILGVLGTNLALRIWHLLAGLPLIVLAALLLRVSFAGRAVLLALPALALALALRFLFTYLLALSAFWTERAHGVVGLGETLLFLLGGSAAPIALFPASLHFIGESLPFRAMLGFPVEIASGTLTMAAIGRGYAWQGLWLVIITLILTWVWRLGVRRYSAIGG